MEVRELLLPPAEPPALSNAPCPVADISAAAPINPEVSRDIFT